MSIPQFLRSFGTEAQCAIALKAARSPDGFRCPRCSSADLYVVGHSVRKLFQCNGCRHQTSLTAGCLMEHTKLPLSTWFLAIYLISQAKTGLSSLPLKRQLAVIYPTAWLLQQKISRAMGQQDRAHRLSGEVQIDDAYLGGERAGGRGGRGSENKVPFAAAVSVNEAGHRLHLKLCVLSGFSSQALAKWAKTNLVHGTVVSSDGLGCFAAVTGTCCLHLPTVVGSLKPRDLPQSFKWINTVLGNLKTPLSGAHHAMNYRKYAEHYLAAFAYRFNRQFDVRGLAARLVVDVARSKPVAERAVRAHAEARFYADISLRARNT